MPFLMLVEGEQWLAQRSKNPLDLSMGSVNEFPWFLKATIEQIYNLEFFHGKHLHWPALDIDVALESLQNPEAYPLKYS
jgi:hypothetical protein